MKWPAVALSLASSRREEFGFRFLRLGQSEFFRDGNVSIQLGIELLDAREHQLGQLDGRELALAEELSDLFDRSEGDPGVIPTQNIFS